MQFFVYQKIKINYLSHVKSKHVGNYWYYDCTLKSMQHHLSFCACNWLFCTLEYGPFSICVSIEICVRNASIFGQKIPIFLCIVSSILYTNLHFPACFRVVLHTFSSVPVPHFLCTCSMFCGYVCKFQTCYKSVLCNMLPAPKFGLLQLYFKPIFHYYY